MISGLKGYAQTEPHPPDAAMVMKTAEYLEACNLIFERGILSKKIIRSMDSPVICNIKRGFQFFTNWHEKHQRTGKNYVNIKCQFFNLCIQLFSSRVIFTLYSMCKFLHG